MIYFIQDIHSRAIKIGVSKEPVKRLAALQTAHAAELIIIGLMDGGEQEERALHQLFTNRRGEWFEPTRDLLSFIRENAVSTDALSKAKRVRGKSGPISEFKPELCSDEQWAIAARVIAHKGWREGSEDAARVVDIAYSVHEKYAKRHPGVFPPISREEFGREVDRLVALQHNQD